MSQSAPARFSSATALAFAATRAAVVIGDVDPRAEGTTSEIVAAGGKAAFQKTDVSDSAHCRRWSRGRFPNSARPTLRSTMRDCFRRPRRLPNNGGRLEPHHARRRHRRLSLPQARIGADGRGRPRCNREKNHISMEDFAIAMVDELEQRAHNRPSQSDTNRQQASEGDHYG